MSRKLREGWLIAGLLLALLLAGIFVLRAVNVGRRAHFAVESIRPWMSVPYVAHSRHVPQSVLWEALGIPPHAHDRRPIGLIARQQKKSVEEVMSALKAAIDRAQENPPAKKSP